MSFIRLQVVYEISELLIVVVLIVSLENEMRIKAYYINKIPRKQVSQYTVVKCHVFFNIVSDDVRFL